MPMDDMTEHKERHKNSLLHQDVGPMLKKRYQLSLFNLVLILISLFIAAFFAGTQTAGVFQLGSRAMMFGTQIVPGFKVFAPTKVPTATPTTYQALCSDCDQSSYGCDYDPTCSKCAVCGGPTETPVPSATPTLSADFCANCHDSLNCGPANCKKWCTVCGAPSATPVPTVIPAGFCDQVRGKFCFDHNCPIGVCRTKCDWCPDNPPGYGTPTPKPGTPSVTPGQGTPKPTAAPAQGSGKCSAKGAACTDDYPCTPEGLGCTTTCHKKGVCSKAGTGVDCSWGAGSDWDPCGTAPTSTNVINPNGKPDGSKCGGNDECQSNQCNVQGWCGSGQTGCAKVGEPPDAAHGGICCGGGQVANGSTVCEGVSGGNGAGGSCAGDCDTSAQACRNHGGSPSGSGGCPAGNCCM